MASLGHGPLIMGFVWSLTGFAIVTLAMRFYIRAKVIKMVGWDDWVMLLAMVFQIVFSTMTTVAFHYGLGMHDADMTLTQMVQVLKWVWLQVPFGIMVSILARISVIVLLVRIFGKRSWFKCFLYATGIIQTVLGLALIPVSFAQCTPVQGLWNPTLKPVCWNPHIQQDLGYATQSMFALGDLVYVVFPCSFIYKLNMSRGRKLGLILVLGLGLFALAASVMKVTYVSSSSEAADSQYRASVAVLWAHLEQLLVIIMGCIPPLMQITKLKPFSRVSKFISSICSRIGISFRNASEKDFDSDYSTKQLSSPGGTVGHNETKEPTAACHVPSVGKSSSEFSSLKDDRAHGAVNFTSECDRGSV